MNCMIFLHDFPTLSIESNHSSRSTSRASLLYVISIVALHHKLCYCWLSLKDPRTASQTTTLPDFDIIKDPHLKLLYQMLPLSQKGILSYFASCYLHHKLLYQLLSTSQTTLPVVICITNYFTSCNYLHHKLLY